MLGARALRGAGPLRRELALAVGAPRGPRRGLAGGAAPGSKHVVEATEANFDEVVMNSKVRASGSG
jgi:hypothetical protein